jgi:tetratricopeptide (TPR) repeat protein
LARCAFSAEPENGLAHTHLGVAYYALGKYQDAERELRLGMVGSESRAPSLMMLVQVLAMAKRKPEALKYAEQYHEEFPQYPDDWIWLQKFLKDVE